MTRETKIGLLIGLGFIVVFAVLLSHTGPSVPAGDGLVLAPQNVPGKIPPSPSTSRNPSYVSADRMLPSGKPVKDLGSPTSRPSGRIGLSEPQSMPRSIRETDAGTDQLAVLPLPEPKGLNKSHSGEAQVVTQNKPMTQWEKLLVGPKASADPAKLATANPPRSNLDAGRVAPAPQELTSAMQPTKVETPQPSVRPEVPTVAPTSEAKTEVASNVKKAPPARQEAAKEYIVQKGDTLRKIVKDAYGASSTKVVEFVVTSNKSRIKDKDTIIEGQKLVIPPLPPEMFESAPNFDVSGTGDAVRTVTNEELGRVLASASKGQRTAPPKVKNDVSRKSNQNGEAGEQPDKVEKVVAAAEKPQSSGHRVYEVKPNDTLRSISANQLGSVNYWNEIQKLNPDVNPRKLKPGMKIKVPDRKPLTSGSGAKQVRV